jgi:putative DNA primase/helicase
MGRLARPARPKSVRDQRRPEDLTQLVSRLGERIEELASNLLGAHNRQLSTKHERRYGTRGSLSVAVSGPKQGRWYCHETAEGGDALALIRRIQGGTTGQAIAYGRRWLDGESTPRPRDAPRPSSAWSETKPTRPAAPDRDKAEADAAFISRITAESRPAPGTLCEAYLTARGCPLPADTPLRFHPAVRHPTGLRLPCMIAPITDVLTPARVTGLHLTALRPNGSGKADIAPAKWIRGSKSGGVIRLSPDDQVEMSLGLTEGIETGLTVIGSGWWPVWAAVDAGNLGKLPVLPPLALTIFADHDQAGLKAAEALVQRWRAAGLSAVVAAPPVHGADWNDSRQEGR